MSASFAISIDPAPLQKDADGVVRIGATCVTLDTLILAYRESATPETIADQYPVLTLADIYVIATKSKLIFPRATPRPHRFALNNERRFLAANYASG
jgi:hypothetical protein